MPPRFAVIGAGTMGHGIAQTAATFGFPVTLIDTPGLNSLDALSDDERVTRRLLIQDKVDTVVQIADSKNLARALYLTLQLSETGLPATLALNMQDEAKERGIHTDVKKLSETLGIGAVATTATLKKGIDQLKEKLLDAGQGKVLVLYPPEIEHAVEALSRVIPPGKIRPRSVALMILASGDNLDEITLSLGLTGDKKVFSEVIARTQSHFPDPIGYVIAKTRYQCALQIAESVQKKTKRHRSFGAALFERIGTLCVHPFLGYVALGAILYAAYEFVGVFGAQTAVDWMENTLFGKFIAPSAVKLFTFLPAGLITTFVTDLFVGEYGLVTMGLSYAFAIIFPIVTTFFIFFSLLEDTGYLPRLAYLLNNLFKKIGLNGRAVLPMVLGLGCDTMATLTARVLETKREKIIVTLLLALAIPCSAQLGVILGMMARLPLWAGVLWIGTVVGVLFLVGFSAAAVIPGKNSALVLEMPPIRLPRIRNILIKTFARLEWYVKEAVPLFLYATIALFLLERMGLLAVLIRLGEPFVSGLLGLPAQASEAFLIGFLRRDFGATRFFDLYLNGQMDVIQAVVAMIVITLFVPCVANVLMIVKERGWKTATAMCGFIFPFAFGVGAVVNAALRYLKV